jgi:NDP-sugar pyrophosphorylase family protein
MLAWLKRGGVDETILAVNHLSEKLRMDIGEERLGSKVLFSVEREPLGTAGPIRLAREMLGTRGSFVVVNGDIVSGIDLAEMVKAHQDHSAVATVALVSVRDPRQYGSVTMTKDGLISKFEEKKPGRIRSGLINAGAYVLSPDVLDYIPGGGPASLERDAFPKLAEKGLIRGWKHPGYWYDIGRISEYRRANMELLGGSQMREIEGKRHDLRDGRAIPPLHVGNGVRFGKEVQLGPSCILSERVTVGDRSKVRNSIVFEDTTIGDECTLDGTLVGERVAIGNRSKIGRRTIIAGEISLPDGSVVKPGSVILS